MLEVEIPIRLTLRGPFITKSTSPRGYGVDASPARERGGEERLTIPGTHLLGKLRQAWEELAGVLADKGRAFPLGTVDDWLGSESQQANWAPKTKRLSLSDVLLDGAEPEPRLSYRIRIDRNRLSVQKGAYQVIESPFAPGAQPEFVGSARFIARDQTEADLVLHWLDLGFNWIAQLGAERSIGFGRLLKVDVQRPKLVPLAQGGVRSLQPARAFRLEVKPLAPFCFAKRRRSRNLYESGEVIPGGALKGAIARRLEQSVIAYPHVREHLAAIRITHAFPSAGSARPLVTPLSLVKKRGASDFVDAALAGGPFLLDGEAPEFAVDWKDRSMVDAAFGWPKLSRELRVRTQIDPQALRADDDRLFAYELIVPGDCRWLADLILPDLSSTELASLCAELEDLFVRPLEGLGKTKARAEIGLLPAVRVNRPLAPVRDHWLVTLQTPALLCDPDRLVGTKATASDLWSVYADAWNDLLGGKLCLVDYFASQSLAGGAYLYKRFQHPAPYRPYLLTDAGSLFVLRTADGNAAGIADLLDAWLCDGLPLPDWAKKRFARNGEPGDHWRNCPYIPQNGYGEIAVNLPVHTDSAHQPPEGLVTWLDAPYPAQEQDHAA